MKTAKQRENAFKNELIQLLKKHGAYLEVTDNGKDYGMHKGICTIYMPTIIRNDRNIADYCEFNLETFLP